MTCISLRSGLWLSKICDASIPQFHTYPKLHSKAFSGRIWKIRQNTKCHGEVSYTLSDQENHLRNLHFFAKFIKPPNRWLIKEWMISDSIITVLSCNCPRTWKSYTLHKDQGKGWIKMPTYLNCGRILCCRNGTYEIYSA